MVVASALPVVDNYRWLENGDSLPTQRWLDAQRARYNEHLGNWPAHHWLADRITALLCYDEWSVPRRRGTREFATLLRAGADHPQLLCREHPHSDPIVLVDPTIDGGPHASLNAWEPSPTGALIAFQLSYGGVEHGELVIRAVDGGEVVDGPIDGVRYSPIVWVNDSGFYYIRQADPDGPGAVRHRGIWFHRVGTPTRADTLVFVPDETHRTVLDVYLHHCRWLVITEGTAPATATTCGSPT